MRRQTIISLFPILALGAGCAANQGEKVRDAHMAQIEVQKESDLEAVDERADQGMERVDAAHERREEAIDERDPKAEGAQHTLAEVDHDRKQFRVEAQERVQKLAVRIDAAKQKIEVLGSSAPTALRTQLEDLRTKHSLAARKVSELEAVPPDQWGKNRSNVDDQLDRLDKRVDELSDAIDDVG